MERGRKGKKQRVSIPLMPAGRELRAVIAERARRLARIEEAILWIFNYLEEDSLESDLCVKR